MYFRVCVCLRVCVHPFCELENVCQCVRICIKCAVVWMWNRQDVLCAWFLSLIHRQRDICGFLFRSLGLFRFICCTGAAVYKCAVSFVHCTRVESLHYNTHWLSPSIRYSWSVVANPGRQPLWLQYYLFQPTIERKETCLGAGCPYSVC